MSKAKDAAASAPRQEILPPEGAKPGDGKPGDGKPGDGKMAKGKKSALAKFGIVPEPPQDVELEGLMSEIEADLREEELKKLWKKYGNYVIAVVAVIVVAVVGVQLWRQQTTERRLDLAARYEQAEKELAAGRIDDALGMFTDVAKSSGEGYATLATLDRAAILLQKNDLDGAVAAYKALAADTKADRVFRDLGTLLAVLHSMDRDDAKTLEASLSPLTSPNNAFSASALELSAVLAAKQGEPARASKFVEQILADSNAPQSLRQRAEDLAAYYKGLIPSAPPATPPAKPPAKP